MKIFVSTFLVLLLVACGIAGTRSAIPSKVPLPLPTSSPIATPTPFTYFALLFENDTNQVIWPKTEMRNCWAEPRPPYPISPGQRGLIINLINLCKKNWTNIYSLPNSNHCKVIVYPNYGLDIKNYGTDCTRENIPGRIILIHVKT